ncbi:hypothetical protein EI94DRAFT_1806377 [Lactarius quietus]|nr:hypothetical protein EI94DRAFT_1806377 [Lactarius quietus]
MSTAEGTESSDHTGDVDELIDEWTSELLGAPTHSRRIDHLASVPVVSGANESRLKLDSTGKRGLNIAGYNSTEQNIKVRSMETRRKYCVRSSVPLNFTKLMKYRLILEESISFGTVGRTGRGLTVHYKKVPTTQIGMLVGSIANRLNSSGRFCDGSCIVKDHRIKNTSFISAVAVPALLAFSISEGSNILWNTPPFLSTLQENHVRSSRREIER